MAYTNAQYAALCAAIAQGVTTVEMEGRRVTYRSLAEMDRIKAAMEAELGVEPVTRPSIRAVQIITGKGL